MEDLFTERFSYATITSFKNYSKLKDKKKSLNSMSSDLDTFDGDGEEDKLDRKLHIFFEDYNKPRVGRVVDFPERRDKRRTHFFYGDSPINERVNLNYAIKNFDTVNDNQIKRHFGNPFSEIAVTITERSIRRHGDKITIKVYHGLKFRRFNSVYFRKSYHVSSLTINTKTGNFTTLDKTKNGHKTSSKFRTNGFMQLNNIVTTNYSFFNVRKRFDKNSRLYSQMLDAFNDIEFTSKVQEMLFGDGVKSFGNYTVDPNKFTIDLMNYFIKKKDIKIPNGEVDYFFTKFYPTEKYLKKNERKLIASVLDMIGLKSKSTIKILHKHPNLDLIGLSWLCGKLGVNYSKYLHNIEECILKRSNRTDGPYSYIGLNKNEFIFNKNNAIEIPLLEIEKQNLLKVLADDDTNRSVLGEQSTRMYDDHFNMINKIRKYDPSVYMKARTFKEFNDEHRELSKILSGIRKGWVIEYQYDKKTTDDIESPLECLFDDKTLHTLYPVILKREEDYIEEGDFMHHCVASYADKDKSIIISLRNQSGSDRVTVEYEIQNGRPLQKRHFCNGTPPETFSDGLLLLDDKVRLHAKWGTLNWKEKKKVPIKINGIEISTEDRGPRQPEFAFPF